MSFSFSSTTETNYKHYQPLQLTHLSIWKIVPLGTDQQECGLQCPIHATASKETTQVQKFQMQGNFEIVWKILQLTL